MNPWDSLDKPDSYLNLEKLKQALEARDEHFTSRETEKKSRYNLKERDYVTYNYLDTKLVRKSSENLTEADSVNEVDGFDTLKSILWRSHERQEKRKYLDEFRNQERIRKKKEELEKQKRKIEEEKRKHKNLLDNLKEEYLLKKEKESIRRQNEARFLKLHKVANSHHELYLLRFYFEQFKKLSLIKKREEILARRRFESKITANYFDKWRCMTKKEIQIKIKKSEKFYNQKILRKYFYLLKEERAKFLTKSKKSQNFYSKNLTHKFYVEWKKFAEEEKLKSRIKFYEAKKHYERKLKWRTIQALKRWIHIRRRRKKEERLQTQLRDVVKNVLPDFSPNSSSSSSSEEEEFDEAGVGETRLEDKIWKYKISAYLC